jgi:hypothetical protein
MAALEPGRGFGEGQDAHGRSGDEVDQMADSPELFEFVAELVRSPARFASHQSCAPRGKPDNRKDDAWGLVLGRSDLR